jgi:hypothetical protein
VNGDGQAVGARGHSRDDKPRKGAGRPGSGRRLANFAHRVFEGNRRDAKTVPDLSEVERSFANLKDMIDMRPIYHQTDVRVQAHFLSPRSPSCSIAPSRRSSPKR